MLELAQDVGHRLHVYGKRATGVAIAIKDNHLATKQWQCPLPYPTQSAFELAREAFSLFKRSYEWRCPIRAVTVRAIGLVAEDTPYQTDLFTDTASMVRREALDRTVEALRKKYGNGIIRNAVLMNNPLLPAMEMP